MLTTDVAFTDVASTDRAAVPALAAERPAPARKDVFLMPGHVWFGDQARGLVTLLGSCCAITLWHPRLRVAGMCHYLLPRRELGEGDLAGETALDGRYGDEAFALLVAEVERTGAPLSEYQIRIFGGANMFSAFGKSTLDIGLRNAALAEATLARLALVPASVDVGGTAYRRLRMTPATGHVTVHYGR